MGWSYTSDECKDYSPEQLNKEHMKSNLKALRYTRKRPLYTYGRRQLGGEPPMHSRSVVKIFYTQRYCIRMITQKIRMMDCQSMTKIS
jgi:hypothetical protein